METSPHEQKDRIWELIESEKTRDRRLHKVSVSAWTLTFAALLFTAVGIGFEVWRAAKAFIAGQAELEVVFNVAMPFVWVAGTISLLIAILSTVGVFLRFRLASLAEIRLRLAAVEQMLTDQQGEADHEVL